MTNKSLMNPEVAKNLTRLKNLHLEIKNQAEEFLCFSTQCDNISIDSHSISEARVLEILVKDKREKLFVLEDEISPDYKNGKMSSFQARNRKLAEKHTISASTFRGFCDPHDTHYFKELDKNPYRNDPKINFLHAVRAYAYKLCMERVRFQFIDDKMNNILGDTLEQWKENTFPQIERLMPLLDSLPDNEEISWELVKPLLSEELQKIEALSALGVDTNTPVYTKVMSFLPIDENLYPIKVGYLKKILQKSIDTVDVYSAVLQSSEKFKEFELIAEFAGEVLKHQEETTSKLTNCLTEEIYDEFMSESFSIEGIFQIAGNFIYYTPNNEEVVLTFFPEKETNKTWFIFTVWKPSQSQRVYLSKLKLMEHRELTQYISNIILSQGTNTYLSKQFYDSLPERQKTTLSQVKTLQAFLTFNMFYQT